MLDRYLHIIDIAQGAVAGLRGSAIGSAQHQAEHRDDRECLHKLNAQGPVQSCYRCAGRYPRHPTLGNRLRVNHPFAQCRTEALTFGDSPVGFDAIFAR